MEPFNRWRDKLKEIAGQADDWVLHWRRGAARDPIIISHAHKLSKIEPLLQLYPDLPFILIGDSGQQDPEIYREIVKKYPRRIRVIYVRSVNPDPARIAAIDALIGEVQQLDCQLVLVPDSEFAAVHAAAEGLIAPESLALVRAHKTDDQQAPAVNADEVSDISPGR